MENLESGAAEGDGGPLAELSEVPAVTPVPQSEHEAEAIVTPRKRQVLITSNCQTGGIELCLRAMLPDTEFQMLYVWQLTPEHIEHTRAAIDNADIWLTIMRDPASLEMAEGKQVMKIPYLNFPGFHPDICYVHLPTGGLARCAGDSDYHSLLAFWSYKNGLSVEQAKAMFRKEVYREIGYFDGWDSSIAEQRHIFDDSDLSFDDYIRPLVARAPFMHTPNHPTGAAINQLSKMIARRITGDDSVMKLPLDYLVQDTLSHVATWPLYPEIAEQYGQDGCYVWKFAHGQFFTSLDHFLRETYAHYDRQDVTDWTCLRLDNPDLQDKLKMLAGL